MKDIRNSVVLYIAQIIMLIYRESNVIVHVKIYSNIVKLVYVQTPSPVLLDYNTHVSHSFLLH
jgi:hypothetical protein